MQIAASIIMGRVRARGKLLFQSGICLHHYGGSCEAGRKCITTKLAIAAQANYCFNMVGGKFLLQYMQISASIGVCRAYVCIFIIRGRVRPVANIFLQNLP